MCRHHSSLTTVGCCCCCDTCMYVHRCALILAGMLKPADPDPHMKTATVSKCIYYSEIGSGSQPSKVCSALPRDQRRRGQSSTDQFSIGAWLVQSFRESIGGHVSSPPVNNTSATIQIQPKTVSLCRLDHHTCVGAVMAQAHARAQRFRLQQQLHEQLPVCTLV